MIKPHQAAALNPLDKTVVDSAGLPPKTNGAMGARNISDRLSVNNFGVKMDK